MQHILPNIINLETLICFIVFFNTFFQIIINFFLNITFKNLICLYIWEPSCTTDNFQRSMREKTGNNKIIILFMLKDIVFKIYKQ